MCGEGKEKEGEIERIAVARVICFRRTLREGSGVSVATNHMEQVIRGAMHDRSLMWLIRMDRVDGDLIKWRTTEMRQSRAHGRKGFEIHVIVSKNLLQVGLWFTCLVGF